MADDAIAFLDRAIQLQPGDWTLYSAQGVAYDQEGKYQNPITLPLTALLHRLRNFPFRRDRVFRMRARGGRQPASNR